MFFILKNKYVLSISQNAYEKESESYKGG